MVSPFCRYKPKSQKCSIKSSRSISKRTVWIQTWAGWLQSYHVYSLLTANPQNILSRRHSTRNYVRTYGKKRSKHLIQNYVGIKNRGRTKRPSLFWWLTLNKFILPCLCSVHILAPLSPGTMLGWEAPKRVTTSPQESQASVFFSCRGGPCPGMPFANSLCFSPLGIRNTSYPGNTNWRGPLWGMGSKVGDPTQLS